MIIYCACGQPLHYSDANLRTEIEQTIAQSGTEVGIALEGRTWIVPRHYIALHQIKASDLPDLKFPELLDNERTFLPYKFDDGGTIVDPHHRDYTDQIYSHQDTDGQERHFHIPKLRRLIQTAAVPVAIFPVDDEQAAFVAGRSPLDEHHISRIAGAYLDEPGIICFFDDGSQLIVDGNHRYIKRNRLKLETMEFWLVPESAWRLALLAMPHSLISFT